MHVFYNKYMIPSLSLCANTEKIFIDPKSDYIRVTLLSLNYLSLWTESS